MWSASTHAYTSTRSPPTSPTGIGCGGLTRTTTSGWKKVTRHRRSSRNHLTHPARHQETILSAQIELSAVHAARRYFDPVGHYHRPDIFQLNVDTRPRP